MDNNFNNDKFQICRICIKEITNASFFYLDCTPAANTTQLTIRQKLHSCIPELDLSIVSNAVICRKCVDNLHSVYEFKKNCLQSEIQINKYIQQLQHTRDLNLLEVVRCHQPDIKNFDSDVKMEDSEITENLKNGDLHCDTSTFNIATASERTESTEPKFLLKLEKVDTQYEFFNTFDNYNINYNLSAAEENSSTAQNSNISQNCLSKVIEHQDNYNKNLNKTYTYYEYSKCGHKAESNLKLISHLQSHTQKNYHRGVITKSFSRYHKNLFCYRCSLCNYSTKYKCLFDFHNRIHLTKKYYKHIFKYADVHTKGCYTITAYKSNIKDNKRKCANNFKNYHKPNFKNLNKFKESKQNFRHRNINNLKPDVRAEKPFKCSICEYQCKWKINLERHVQSHTREKSFSCAVCKYQCSRKSSLKQHIRIHTGEKPFLCSVCKYQCSQKGDLNKHIRIHTGEKPFSCYLCEYQCSQKTHLNQHILIHTGQKPFSCSVCEYRCRRKSNLKQHMHIHTGEKSFSCAVCEYQCSQKSKLNRHMRTHTGEKPFSCSVCEYQCSQKSHLNRHMRTHM